MAQRIKGQEIKLSFVTPTGPSVAFDHIVSAEFETVLEVMSEEYLGQVADLKDEVFRCYKGRIEYHMANQDFLVFEEAVISRAQRRTPASGVFNLTASWSFPNGQRPRLTYENIFFGPFPSRINKRTEYVSGSLDWECSTRRRIS